MRIEGVRDMVHVRQVHARLGKTEVDRVVGQLPGGERKRPLRVLDARKAFFFGGGDEAPVLYQAGGRVVVHRVDSEGDHARSSRAAAVTRSGGTRFRQSWCPAGQVLL